MRFVYIAVLLSVLGIQYLHAEPIQDELSQDVLSYCKYIEEKNKARSDLLTAPDVVVWVQNANIDYPYQNNIVSALSKNLSDFGKAKQLKQLIKDECAYYRLSQEAKVQIQYAIPTIQRQALLLKLHHIRVAKSKLKEWLGKIQNRIDKKNDTLSTYYQLDALVQRLDDAERDIDVTLALQPPHEINKVRLKTLFNRLVQADKRRLATRNRLAKQDNWSLELQTGAQQNITISNNQNIQPYVAVIWRYHLGAPLSNRERDKALEQYADWKNKKVNGIQKQLLNLIYSMNELESAEQKRLEHLKQNHQKYEGVSKKMDAIDSLRAAHFKQQIEVDRIMMEVEMNYAQSRIDLLHRARV
jgi:transcription initiation factor TFIIIB Brf1 subunit/transcription initiation factor TFIIB